MTKKQKKREKIAQFCEQIDKKSIEAKELRNINRKIEMRKGKTRSA